jgi:hypothetical protein
MVRAVRSAAGTITYGNLVQQIASIQFEPDSTALRELLGEISTEEDAAGRGMLSVVVVLATGEGRGQPGDGFFTLAQKLGRHTHDRLQFWAAEFDRVRQAWPRN